jgi:hypothetical protein
MKVYVTVWVSCQKCNIIKVQVTDHEPNLDVLAMTDQMQGGCAKHHEVFEVEVNGGIVSGNFHKLVKESARVK